MDFNKRVKKLQSHVLSIRFNKGLTVVDTDFKEGWTVSKSNVVGYERMDGKPTYYMLYGLNDDVGVEEILDHVEYTIHANIEREKKYELLKVKKKELENIFKTNHLDKCLTLRFMFDDVTVIGDEMELKDMPIIEEEIKPQPISQPVRRQPVRQQPVRQQQPKDEMLAEDITYSQQPKPAEELEEVKTVRREVDQDIVNWENQNRTHKTGSQTIELPPKKANKVELEEFNVPTIVCKCNPNDPNEICPECMDSKM